MGMKKLKWIFLIILALVFGGAGIVFAEYPEKPITLLLGWPAGGNTDIIVRPYADAAAKVLGQPILILNKPGAATSLSLVQLKNEKPDGYTIGYITGSSILMQHMQSVPYDVNQDFTPIARFLMWNCMGVAVRADSPWKSIQDFVAYAKANPGKIKYTSPSTGNPNHMAMEILGKETGVKWVHVPGKNCQDALTMLLGKHVDASSSDPCWKPHVQEGRLRLLATWGKDRSQTFPEVPTLVDMGYKTSVISFGGIIAPKGLPAPIADKLQKAFREAMKNEEFKRVAQSVDIDVSYNSPEGLAKDVRELNAQYQQFVNEFGLAKK
jgi:tripartite-type tricarboxylate transporter receptor subunit TctC